MTPCPPLALLMAALVAGCGSFPQLEAAVGDDKVKPGYLPLMPVTELRAAAAPPPRSGASIRVADAAEPAAEIDARAARLRARAARLRGGTVIDPETKERLDSEIVIEQDDI